DFDCDSGFEVDGEVVFENRDLGNKPFDQRFIKFCDGCGLLPDEILQVLDVSMLSVVYTESVSVPLGRASTCACVMPSGTPQ
ncbi:MAG: hypothetical protein II008_04125, partial [Oscillospiraceae bacterium]|nr:hypothetical protein [Oscillospiraceae bacterium]